MKKILSIVALSMFGVAVNAQTTQNPNVSVAPHRDIEHKDFWETHGDEMKLTPQQITELRKAKIEMRDEIIAEKMRMRDMNRNSLEKIKVEREAYNRDLRRILNEEQYRQYGEIKSKRIREAKLKLLQKKRQIIKAKHPDRAVPHHK